MGEFSLSPAAVVKLAQFRGKDAYFFESVCRSGGWSLAPITFHDACGSKLWIAFTIPEPGRGPLANKAEQLSLVSDSPEFRTDLNLIRVIEELGPLAGNELAVVEIPDGVQFDIVRDEFGEHIAEKHRTWR